MKHNPRINFQITHFSPVIQNNLVIQVTVVIVFFDALYQNYRVYHEISNRFYYFYLPLFKIRIKAFSTFHGTFLPNNHPRQI